MSSNKRTKTYCCNMISENLDSRDFLSIAGHETEKGKPTILLHSCCGPCSTSVIERLVPDYDVTVFFYNPNITDEKEYKARRDAQIKFIKEFNETPEHLYKVAFREGSYDPKKFYEVAQDFSDEKEGGRRCEKCFMLRLEKTAELASLLKFDSFATTLTVSPHKDYESISRIGKKLAVIYGVGFTDMDFKKKAGFQRSIELSKKYDLYRQKYCGCEYSQYE